MFSFHKPKIYRSNSGCCICRAKSSSSRFTDSKKYEPEFEKCFRTVEKRSGEICNACVLLVKRWKKLPTGTNRNWQHVVDARAGPGTKSFKSKPCEPKKRSFKSDRDIAVLCKDSKVRHESMTSSESESEEDEEEMIDELDSLVEPPSSPLDGQRSLRRSSRLNTSSVKGNLLRYKSSSGARTDRNNNFNSNGTKNGMPKRRSLLRPEHFFSFLDTSFWQKEEVCCGVIFKGPNNEVIIYPELLTPCGCRKRSRPFSLSTASLSSSSESESFMSTSSKPPSLVQLSPVAVSPEGTIFSTPNNNANISMTESNNKKTLRHQDSFTNSDTSSEPCSNSSHDELDDRSSGVSSLTALDETSMMVPDSDLSSSISDRLSTVSSMCLLMDADDGSSNASTATYDGLNHHELEMVSDHSPVKGTSSSVVQLASLAPNTAVFSV